MFKHGKRHPRVLASKELPSPSPQLLVNYIGEIQPFKQCYVPLRCKQGSLGGNILLSGVLGITTHTDTDTLDNYDT